MNTWVCIAWEDQTLENGHILPTPITKITSIRPELSDSQVLYAFRRKFPHLRNHTVHLKSKDTEQVVIHRGPGDYPIALDRSLSPATQAMQEAHGTPALRGQDGALQIEPPDKLTAASLAIPAGEVASQKPESGSNPHSLRESRVPSPRLEPRRAYTTPPSSKDCALSGADSSGANAQGHDA